MIPISEKDSKCFQYAVAVVLNHEEIKTRLPKNNKIKSLQINITGKE